MCSLDESLPSSKRIRSGLSTYVPICQSTSMAKAQQQLPVLIPQQQQHIILDSSNPPGKTTIINRQTQFPSLYKPALVWHDFYRQLLSLPSRPPSHWLQHIK